MPLNHTSQYSELTDEQYIALGKAVVEWANVEQLLGVLLARLLATPDFLARTFTDPLSAFRLQEAIQEALEIHRVRYGQKLVSEELRGEIFEVNQAVTALRAMRNKIAHFCWCRQTDDTLFGTSFSGGIPTPKSELKNSAVLSLIELSELNSSAFALVERLMRIVEKIPAIQEEMLLTLRSSSFPSVAGRQG